MITKTMLRNSVSLATILAGSAAMADVTPQQVWENWQAQIAQSGEIALATSGEDISGDTLVVRGVTLNLAQDDTDVVAAIGDLIFAGQGDGTVAVSMAPSYPVTITGPDDVVVTVIVSQTGLDMRASGTPDALDYTISADTYSIALRDIVDGNDTFTADASITANAVALATASRTAATRDLSYDGSIGSLDLLVDAQIPEAPGDYITIGGKFEDIAMQAQSVMPPVRDDAALMQGAFSLGYTIARGSFVFDINSEGDQASGSVATGTSTLTTQVSPERVTYATNTRDLDVSVTAAAMPVPVNVTLEQYGVTLDVPTARADSPVPFALGIDLVNLAMNDGVWNLIDPAGVLPRDPATVQIALTGLVRPLFDLFDPAQEQAMLESDVPAELHELTLSRLNIAVAGATLTGEGGFTFDNTDMTTFAPLPRPLGQVSFTMTGLNALLDDLVAMGVAPADQMMAPRMMIGMFARATGDDQLESTIEVDASGAVKANGQRIR